ncbi:hypothetical protein DEU56DRAFT_512496 [Suillus clintonianus]|uniref:uncharacterized protein n=1 Tax=Suillus clintonianus TaxID=1904413 RepID=UPI001B86A21F|nr:uncharacterized protein DEU56DRAFT_512496 [Suillus clintonianus]KAG2152722.1 hypothetical protein DEU56DRAFT_512496 [Suillus clintonianus]
MPYNYWNQDSELYKQVEGSLAEYLQGPVSDEALSTSQPQQNHWYHVPEKQPEPHAADSVLICEWNACGYAVHASGIAEHMSSKHLEAPKHGETLLACRWKGCQLQRPIRRDTLIRHIREMHFGMKSRRKLRVASGVGSHKNAQPTGPSTAI